MSIQLSQVEIDIIYEALRSQLECTKYLAHRGDKRRIKLLHQLDELHDRFEKF